MASVYSEEDSRTKAQHDKVADQVSGMSRMYDHVEAEHATAPSPYRQEINRADVAAQNPGPPVEANTTPEGGVVQLPEAVPSVRFGDAPQNTDSNFSPPKSEAKANPPADAGLRQWPGNE